MFQLPSRMQDRLLVLPTRVRDIGLADRHVSPRFPPPIEGVRDHPAPRPRHQGFQSDDLALDPLWLGLGEDPAGR